jgi:arylformamidase
MNDVEIQTRVKFDFEIDFTHGGGLQGRDFRLDIGGEAIGERELADLLVRDLRLLMVASVRIRNKEIIREPHKRPQPASGECSEGPRTMIDLSHVIETGMITYRGLPAPLICDFMSHEESRRHYSPGTSFQIGRIDMVASTGTYLDSPYHRFEHGKDVSELPLAGLAGLPAVTVDVQVMSGRAVGRDVFLPVDVRRKAVLLRTGWSRHWRTERYFEGHPFLTEPAALHLMEQGAALVGIDSLNIDDTSGGDRPAHTILLSAGIPIVEHLCNLDGLPASGFEFTAAPLKVMRMGTFPVRAYAMVPHP